MSEVLLKHPLTEEEERIQLQLDDASEQRWKERRKAHRELEEAEERRRKEWKEESERMRKAQEKWEKIQEELEEQYVSIRARAMEENMSM